MNARNWVALALAVASLGMAVWGVILLIVMVAHAIGAFVTALVILAIASALGWGSLLLSGKDVISRILGK